MDYLLHVLILVGIFSILSVSLNLISGYAGLISIAHAAFYGVGAYGAALLALKLHLPFLPALALAIIPAVILGLLVAWPSLRIHDDYFVIATFAFQIITFSLLNNWMALTGGPMGLPGIPRPRLFGWEVNSHLSFLVLVAVFAAAVVMVCGRIVNSPYGRVLCSIREDEVFARAAGKDVSAFKVMVFVVGAGMAAVAGTLYAYYISFIDPNGFTVMESILMISMVIVGGAGSMRGAVLGAVVLVSLPELIRFIGIPASVAADIRQLLYGALLVAFMLWRPQGLVGRYAFRSVGEKIRT